MDTWNGPGVGTKLRVDANYCVGDGELGTKLDRSLSATIVLRKALGRALKMVVCAQVGEVVGQYVGVWDGIGVVALGGPRLGARKIEASCMVVRAMEMSLMWSLKTLFDLNAIVGDDFSCNGGADKGHGMGGRDSPVVCAKVREAVGLLFVRYARTSFGR